MFKLKQIQYKSNNAPEIEKKYLKYQIKGEMDAIYHLKDGLLTNDTDDTTRSGTLYVGLEDLDPLAPFRNIKCYRITKDMIFKIRFYVSGVTPTEGMRLKLKTNSVSGYIALQTDTDGTGEAVIVGLDNYAATRDILIRFDKV